MKAAFLLLTGCFAIVLALSSPIDGVSVQKFEVADCDDVTFGPDGDLYLACHSPDDRLAIDVRGAKAVADEMDAYVLRWNPRTRKLIYATRIGGSSYDAALRVKIDRAGYAHATGLTRSEDFGGSSGDRPTKFHGGSDAFWVKLAPDGQIVHAILIGGSRDDVGNGLDLDSGGNIYVGGTTSSSDFPAQHGSKESNDADAFLCAMRVADSSLACRVFGGAQEEKLTGVAVDSRDGLYAVGYTRSKDFPTKNPAQAALAGPSDAFLTRLALSNLEITFSTFLGGTADDSGWGVAVSRSGNPVVGGITGSTDLPGTRGGYQQSRGGKKDAFLASFRGRDLRQIHATYFGGADDDEAGYDGGSIKIDRHGTVWLAGITLSFDLPTRNAVQSRFGGGNANGFVASFSPDLRNLCFSSYYGGAHRTLLEGLATSESGMVAATGVSFSEVSTPFHIQLARTAIHAGAFLVLFRNGGACSN
jgi:hypothetical protein